VGEARDVAPPQMLRRATAANTPARAGESRRRTFLLQILQ